MVAGRRALVAACGTLALVTACTAAGGHAKPTPTPAAADLVILHTNDDWGETRPCG
jgi:hypothetical protein